MGKFLIQLFSMRPTVTFRSSGMSTLRAFLIMGCGFSSSLENLHLRGSNISSPAALDRARSAGSGSYFTGTWMAVGSKGLGMSLELGRPGRRASTAATQRDTLVIQIADLHPYRWDTGHRDMWLADAARVPDWDGGVILILLYSSKRKRCTTLLAGRRAGRADLVRVCDPEDVSLKLGRWVGSKVAVQRKEKDMHEGTHVAIETKHQTPAFLVAIYLVGCKLVHLFAVIRKIC